MGSGAIDEAAVSRILKAVGSEHVPCDLKQEALTRCLNLCFSRYQDAIRFASRSEQTASSRQLEKARKAAKRLAVVLEAGEVGDWSVTSPSGGDLKSRDFANKLVCDIDAALRAKRSDLEQAYADTFKAHSPFEWLVGIYLPDVYELNFQKKPTVSEDGPFVRFGESVLRELGVAKDDGAPYKRSSIARTLRSIRAGRRRRRETSRWGDVTNWSFAALCRAYKSCCPAPHEVAGGDEQGSQFEYDPDQVLDFLVKTRHPSIVVALYELAQKSVEKGVVPPGCRAIDVIEPIEETA